MPSRDEAIEASSSFQRLLQVLQEHGDVRTPLGGGGYKETTAEGIIAAVQEVWEDWEDQKDWAKKNLPSNIFRKLEDFREHYGK